MHTASLGSFVRHGDEADLASGSCIARPWLYLSATPAARRLVARLRARHGPLMFHQAGTLRAPDAPLCFSEGDFPLVERDVLLGDIDGAPFYLSQDCCRCYGAAWIRLDPLPGRAGVFSLERWTGLHFTTTSGPLHPG